jgi:hypothetical protein
MKISISEAAKMAKINRANLYRNWINKGKISVETNSEGKKVIDSSEVLRCFSDKVKATPNGDKASESNTIKKRQANSSNNLILQAKDDLIKVKDEMIMLLNKDKEQLINQLEQGKETERFLQDQIKQLTLVIQNQPRQIEHNKGLIKRFFS